MRVRTETWICDICGDEIVDRANGIVVTFVPINLYQGSVDVCCTTFGDANPSEQAVCHKCREKLHIK